MPSFVFGPLLWGLIAVAAPLLIHLINMMRHRRIRWAAMEFLLQSQKRNRTWVMLKQFLLLLLRMAAIAAVVLLVAQPLFKESFGSFLGGTRTHHIVLLDDSYSQSDTWGNTNAFKDSVAAIEQLSKHIIGEAQESPQGFTLIRFSQAANQAADLKDRTVNGEFKAAFDATIKDLHVSQLDSGPLDALKLVNDLDDGKEGNRVVYIVSDFRAKEWGNAEEVRKQLVELTTANVQLHLVQTVYTMQRNLGVVGLSPEPGVRAAGVEMFMNVAVHNFGDTAERDVAVSIRQDDGDSVIGIKFDSIPPGETRTKRFPINFKEPKAHRVTAFLPGGDAVPTDDNRYCVVDVANKSLALLVDGDPKAVRSRSDSLYMSRILDPGGQVNTGIRTKLAGPRDLSKDHALDDVAVVYLLNIDRLDDPEVKALTEFVQAGGGVAFFTGPQTNVKFFNDTLYAEGKGVFPAPLVGAVDLLVDRTEKIADIKLTDHPVFRVFSDQTANLTSLLWLEKYFATNKDWQPGNNSTTKVIATTRNGAPLAIEKKFGEGRVLAVLTTAAPFWNNWSLDPAGMVWIPTVLQLHSYLSGRTDVERFVGSELALSLPLDAYQPPFTWAAFGQSALAKIEKSADHRDGDKLEKATKFELVIPTNATRQAGFYELSLPRATKLVSTDTADKGTADTSVEPEKRTYALNVVPEEGNLKLQVGDQLVAQLKGIKLTYHRADQMHYDSPELAGFNVSKSWGYLFLLIMLLLGEQLLAYAISYHPSPKEAAR